MTGGQAEAATGQVDSKFTVRDGVWIATGVIAVIVAAGVVLWVRIMSPPLQRPYTSIAGALR